MRLTKKTQRSYEILWNNAFLEVANNNLKGNKSTTLARLIAFAKTLWCLAQVPVIRLGRILPPSVIYFFKRLISL